MYNNIIVIPYRDRKDELQYFIDNSWKLIKTKINNCKLVIVEQDDYNLFNRGLILNIGFKEYLDKTKYFITHDVDINPKDKILPYYDTDLSNNTILNIIGSPCITLGGITKISNKDIKDLDGFTNKYFGWGCEDKNLYNRAIYNDKKIVHVKYTNDKDIQNYIYRQFDDKERIKNNDEMVRYLNEYKLFNNLSKENKQSYISNDGISTLNYSVLERISLDDDTIEHLKIRINYKIDTLDIILTDSIKNYWLNGNNHYSMYDKNKFINYFFSFINSKQKNIIDKKLNLLENNKNNNKNKEQIYCFIIDGKKKYFKIPLSNNDIKNKDKQSENNPYKKSMVIYDIYDTTDNKNKNNINVLLSIENIKQWTHYNHYNKYGEYGDKNIDVYIYNHVSKFIETSSYIVIPTIYLQTEYFNKYYNSIKPALFTPFQNKKFCLITSTPRKNLSKELNHKIKIIQNIDKCDHIKDIVNIKNKSCYHSVELLNLFNQYKFILSFENSLHDGYITEKIFNIYFSRSIPIYFGPNDKYTFLEEDSFIDLNNDTNKLASIIKKIMDDEKLYDEYINNKKIKNYDNQDYINRSSNFIYKSKLKN